MQAMESEGTHLAHIANLMSTSKLETWKMPLCGGVFPLPRESSHEVYCVTPSGVDGSIEMPNKSPDLSPKPQDPFAQHLGDSVKSLDDKHSNLMEKVGVVQTDLARIQTTIGWHWKIGTTVVAVFAAVFGWFLSSQLPKDLDSAGMKVKSDLGSQFNSLQLEVVKLEAKLEVQRPGASEKMPSITKEKAAQDGSGSQLRLNMEGIKAIAAEAQEVGIVAHPAMMVDASNAVLKLASFRRDAAPQSWEAVSSLVNYQAFLFGKLYGISEVAKNTRPCIENPGPVVAGTRELVTGTKQLYKLKPLIFSDCSQVLDGTFWDNVKFERCLLIYRGGRVVWGVFVANECLAHVDLTEEPKKNGHDLIKMLLSMVSPKLELGPNSQQF